MLAHALVFALALGTSLASLNPTAKLDSANVTGIFQGRLKKFLGIPFASPPTGNLRFRPAEALGPYKFSVNATAYGRSCPSQAITFPTGVPANISATVMSAIVPLYFAPQAEPSPDSEDCLTINVIAPSSVTAEDRLPVAVWIYGGGFEAGSTVGYDAMGVRLVNRSIALGTPMIYVSMNYRVSAYGFLGGEEVMKEKVGNLGLIDRRIHNMIAFSKDLVTCNISLERVALRWVQRYIQNFGGDKSKVMIWGESAGSISVALQMVAYRGNSENLFHAAFMQSGAVLPVGNITNGQSLALAWTPRTDGVFLVDDPHKLVKQGLVARVSVVSGTCDDEGTLFAFSSRNVTTEADFRQYVSEIFISRAPGSELEPLWSYYPSTPSEGSPFGTGDKNKLTPQFKRMAAFQGDVVFIAPTRFLLQNLSGKQKIWSYLSRRWKFVWGLGSFHFSDIILQLMDDYIVRFAVNHDPNNGTGLFWPEYTSELPQMYTSQKVEQTLP
ncbi:carotenoid ester lipase precursor [Flammula alnicola]|nr:carotenoid ester lipase precursor [Flammula alnicola]